MARWAVIRHDAGTSWQNPEAASAEKTRRTDPSNLPDRHLLDVIELGRVQKQRRKNFEREWDRTPMPMALVYDWQDKPREVFRQILGFLIGEPPPPDTVPAQA